MELISIILSIISIAVTITGIVITIVGVVIPIHHEKKTKLPRLILTHSWSGTKPDEVKDKECDVVLHGYFQVNKEYSNKLKDFLQNKGESTNELHNDIMREITDNYLDGSYQKETNAYSTKIINNIIRKYHKNREFQNLIEEYKNYTHSSRWILCILNGGGSDAIDLSIDLFNDTRGGYYGIAGTLKKDKKRIVSLYYLDKAALLDKTNHNIYWYNEKSMIFYLVDKKKYNKKDEKLFLITYKDIYGNIHKIYCCAKVGKNEMEGFMSE